MQDALGEGPSSGTLAGASAMLLGRVVGACFGRKPTLRTLLAAERLVWSDAGWAAFSAAAASEAGSDDLKLATLVRCLQELVHAFTWAPRTAVHMHRGNICALVDRYRQQPRLDDLWLSRHYRTMLVRHTPAFDALRQSDSDLFLRLLDEFPHPEPSRHILAYAADRMVLDGLLGLLVLARPCFDAGNWLPWVMAPFLIMAAIEAKLETLADPGEDGASSPSDVFDVAAGQAIQSVLERVDGNGLGYAWLQRLIQRRSPGSGRRLGDGRTRTECGDRLLWELASALPPRHDAVDWVRAEQDVFRRDRAVAAIAAAGLGETGDHNAAAALMGQVLRLGLWTTAQEEGFSVSPNPERRLVAAVIGRHVASGAWFDDLWCDLAPVRDRARHAMNSGGGHASDATIIAVSWFLFGLDAVDVRTAAHGTLWRSLHSAVRDSAMTQTSPMAQAAWRARYRFLTAHLAHRLVTLADEETARDLRDLLGPILCLEMTLAEVVTVLFDAGVSPTVVAAGTERPAHLVELLRRLEAEQVWREVKQQERAGTQFQFSRAIARAADMIEGVALATP